ncbi:hypothetical protein SERLADRAFT_443020 [Serpula lacrymans var. lacrymans S7.9]|uniref:Uncharacterized protein n=1 Tax=Serpula lacrymans var. lacrymans (strain S7.9) TaxID=578457 RepID=F8PBB6_SERL9|nr:uncharacterized protein SERLADRAFT_443020 [Serpula lacrymans var. lacrymans S7.9]EGO19556.1 hypothetical protein SERLADRAFT_443020 [Serpula lacrymans var. lacrymans S7.9]
MPHHQPTARQQRLDNLDDSLIYLLQRLIRHNSPVAQIESQNSEGDASRKSLWIN